MLDFFERRLVNEVVIPRLHPSHVLFFHCYFKLAFVLASKFPRSTLLNTETHLIVYLVTAKQKFPMIVFIIG